MNFDHLFEDRDSFVSRLIRRKSRQLVRHPGFQSQERDDIEQELVLELIQKFPYFDPARSRATTFIVRVIDNKAASLVRTRIAKKRDFRRNTCSLNKYVRDADGNYVEFAQTIEAEASKRHTRQVRRTDEELVDLQSDLAESLEMLPDDLRSLAELLKYVSKLAAGRELGKSRRQIAQGTAQLREHFEAPDLREYL